MAVNLFELLGTVAIDTSGASKSIDSVTNKAEKSGSKISGAFEKIGSAAVKMGKIAAAGYAAVSTGITALAKASLEGYADFEQLVGGVETLFGAGGQSLEEYAETVGKTVDEVRDEYEGLMKAQNTVLSNADKAYQTAGMSANEYMETVTSFSASLIQSLDGDTEAAAEKANQAIVDMSDNANKMGTSMESIQNAYQGFAKQNYTMLDNLKLGYGGTQEEMKRLLSDASAISGVEYDISSYADVVDAIHVIQTEMGIAGTTAKEASSTITGSVESAKSAWKNLLAGFGKDDVDLAGLTNQFVDSVITAAENILPRFGVIKDNIIKVAEDLFGKLFDHVSIGIFNTGISFETVAEKVRNTFNNIKDGALSLLKGAIEWFKTDGVVMLQNAWEMIQAGIEIVKPIIQNLFNWLATDGIALMQSVWNAIQAGIEFVLPIIKSIYEIVVPIVSSVVEYVTPLIKGFFDWLSGVFQSSGDETGGFMEKVKGFFESAWNFIKGVWEACQPFFDGVWEHVVEPVGELLSEVAGAFREAWEVIKIVWDKVKPYFSLIWEGIKATFSVVVEHLSGFFKAAWTAIVAVWDVVVAYFTAVWAGIKAVFAVVKGVLTGDFTDAWEAIKNAWGQTKDFFVEIWEGIKSVFGAVGDWFSNVFATAWQKVKDIFTKGGEIFDGITEGIGNFFKTTVNGIIGGINKVIGSAFGGINEALSKLSGIEILGLKPFDWINPINVPQIPLLEQGGVLERGQVGLLEGNGAEAVVPLDQNEKWINEVAKDMGAATGNNALLQKILDVLLEIRNGVPEEFADIIASMKFAIGEREFARLVKAVN